MNGGLCAGQVRFDDMETYGQGSNSVYHDDEKPILSIRDSHTTLDEDLSFQCSAAANL